IAKTEGDAFEYGANDVAARVRSSDADQRAARAAVEMGRALAHEIGRPEKSVGAGMECGGLGGEVGIGRRSAGRTGSERVAKPAQREAGSLRYAHDVPAAGNRVAKGVNAATGIERGAIGGCEDDAGGANGGANRASRDNYHADRASRLSPRASDDWSAGSETAGVRTFRGNFRPHVRRCTGLWHEAVR